MKKILAVLVAVAVLGTFTSAAEAGWRRVRRYYHPPVVVPVPVARPVVVAPRVVAPPVVVARPVVPVFAPPVFVAPRPVFYPGGGVIVRTPRVGVSVGY